MPIKISQLFDSGAIEVVSAEQMLDSYVSLGMPIMYRHWSFGKEFVNLHRRYARGNMGLAYELVINSDPCIAYLMEENDALQQLLVIAHACVGHNSVFKNNYLFKQRTDASAIIDYLNIDEVRKQISKSEQVLSFKRIRFRNRKTMTTIYGCWAIWPSAGGYFSSLSC